ncbi:MULTISPECIES: helix-turn-helix transcriptional regulator [Streptomyces]|uniref:helix-turn-helix transcriptional regulator n=1 Tax=Streptomyces TaxID=1883 RepID=UPI0009A01F94|nr:MULTISPECIES: LuxR family transcriptional regulator [Streptomyces]TFI25856.1 LuxR family transcriptional regulator [Streptomyces sp. 4R-3d]
MRQEFLLVERDHEMGLVRAGMRRAQAGEGALVMFEGVRGAGKTHLLAAARRQAEKDGFQILHARGNEFEQGFPWAVVRQLFDHCLNAERYGDQGDPLAGPASLAGTIFDYADPEGLGGGPQDDDRLYRRLHGLHWLCRNLCSTDPLLLLLDDAHHADIPSLRFVNYLVNRLEGSGVLLVLASTPGTTRAGGTPAAPGQAQELLLSVGGSPVARHAALAPLGPDAVRQTITARLGRPPHDEAAAACLTASAGNPLHLKEILDEMDHQGIEPEQAAVPAIAQLAPARLTKEVLRQLHRLPTETVALAGAVAVLEQDAEPRHCADVAELDESATLRAASALRDADIFGAGSPYAFQRSVVRQVLYAHMSSEARSNTHHRAARCLHATGSELPTVAAHLCRTEPGGDPWTVRTLRAAALDAVRRSEPQEAARYLRRALADPAAEDDPWILGQLGAAELRARQPSAVEHLKEALHRTRDSLARERLRLELALALAASARHEDALTLLRLSDASGTSETARRVAAVLGRVAPGHRVPGRSGPFVVRAHAAVEALARGFPRSRVLRLATGALAQGDPGGGREDAELNGTMLTAWVLAQCDAAEPAEVALRDAVRGARDAGQVLTAEAAESLLAQVLLDTGRLGEAEGTVRRLLNRQEKGSLMTACVPLSAAVLVHCLVERGRTREAEEALRHHGLDGPVPASALFVPLRLARARLLIRQDQFEAGLRELSECRDRARKEGWRYPSADIDCLPDAVRALAVTTGPRAAGKLAADTVEGAKTFGAARPLAVALGAQGEIVGGEAGVAMLERADCLLAPTPYLLEHARVLVALGATLRRIGRRAVARERLTAGMELAHRIGAHALESTAGSELRLAGVRLARASQDRASLTPAEERVVYKAAAGLSNREISQALFVTVKTVEWHLSQAYAKLGIAKRAELSRVLSSEAAADTPAVRCSA